jgi:Cu/Ag efflux pump CusA
MSISVQTKGIYIVKVSSGSDVKTAQPLPNPFSQVLAGILMAMAIALFGNEMEL